MSKKTKISKVVFPTKAIHVLVNELVEGGAVISIHQKDHWCSAEARVYYQGKNYYDVGFSKCNLSYDKPNHLRGIEIARGRALKSIAKRILSVTLPVSAVSREIDFQEEMNSRKPIITLSQVELEVGVARIEEMLKYAKSYKAQK